MLFVYLIESISTPGKRYVGLTDDIDRRLREHNAGKSIHTNKYKPWAIKTFVAFADHRKAEAFERYLKNGSGHAFANKRLW